MQYSMLHICCQSQNPPDQFLTIEECRGVGIFSGLDGNGPMGRSSTIYRPIKELSRSLNISGFGMGRFNIPLSLLLIGPSRSYRGAGIFPGLEWADSTFR